MQLHFRIVYVIIHFMIRRVAEECLAAFLMHVRFGGCCGAGVRQFLFIFMYSYIYMRLCEETGTCTYIYIYTIYLDIC